LIVKIIRFGVQKPIFVLQCVTSVNKTSDYIDLIWTSNIQYLSNNESNGKEFYYFDLQAAESFINAQNAEINASHGCVLPETWHAAMGHCMIQK